LLSDFVKDGDGEVEMLLRVVAPTAIGARRTEVGGGDDHRGRAIAVLGAAGVACKLKASAAGEAGVEESLTESCGVRAIAGAVEVPKSASSACTESHHSLSPQIHTQLNSRLETTSEQKNSLVFEFLNMAQHSHMLIMHG